MVNPERLMVVNVLKRVSGTILMLSQMSLNEVSVVSSGVWVVLSLSTLSSPSAQLVLLTMMTQVEVS